jgi:hypothetical protein
MPKASHTKKHRMSFIGSRLHWMKSPVDKDRWFAVESHNEDVVTDIYYRRLSDGTFKVRRITTGATFACATAEEARRVAESL